MTNNLQGKVAIVTGGASGIGEATALLFAEQGARVLLADINEEAGQQLAEKIAARFVKTDVSDSGQVDALVAEALSLHGRLDIMVNNAFHSETALVEQLSDAQWQKTLQVTLDGVFYGCRAALKVMQPGAAIVNTASISGLGADYGIAAYNTAKAGVINLTRTAAVESGKKGVRVNAVCPGLINTPPLQLLWQVRPEIKAPVVGDIPLGRLGEAEDIAKTILFLASDDAAYVHGATLVVDGGLTASSGIARLLPDL